MDSPSVVQNSFRQRGLARVDVRRDPNVANPIHGLLPPWLLILFGPRKVPSGELVQLEGAGEERDGGRCGRRRHRLGGGSVESVKEAMCGGPREACHGCCGAGFPLRV